MEESQSFQPPKLFYQLAKRRGSIVKSEEILEYLYSDGEASSSALLSVESGI